MKIVFCANCGTRLSIMRKAMPKYGKIIDIVEYHECPDEPVKIDLEPVDISTFVESENKNQFVQQLNDLQPPSILGSIGSDLKDKRKTEDIKGPNLSSAPSGLSDLINSMQNSIPEGDIGKEPNDA